MRRWLLAVCLGATACSRDETPTGGDFKEVPADMVMTGMTQYMTSGGLRRARMQGDTAYVFDDSGTVKVKGVNLLIYNEVGAEVARLLSKTGDFNTTTQGMIARGKVVLTTLTAPRREILTEQLHYDPQSHRLWSDVATVMIEAGSRVTGDGFTADDKFTNVNIRGARGRVGGLKVQF